MKTINKVLVVMLLGTSMLSSSVGALAQTPATNANKTRQRFATKNEVTAENSTKDAIAKTEKSVKNETQPKDDSETVSAAKNLENVLLDAADEKPTEVVNAADGRSAADNKPSDLPEDTIANRHEQVSEEAAVVPYYNNFFNTYRLGPEDVVSVNVFGQDRYSRSGITIPPSGRISLALIPGGVFVNGKTVEEVAEAIRKRYDEYIIDPQVSVSLDKASSYRYSVIGDVGQPGIRLMSHRMSVAEAIGEAGGVLSTGNRSKIIVLRRQADGNLKPIAVNLSAIYKGQAPDNTYLVPGDQVIVPGNKLKSLQKIMSFFPILSFARIFTGGLM
ncbi:MAG TPA: polysaccharide biosynthesis/export family protein [Pyrinomonadaceae bacterium]|nr:polysaccharide biosynthesis/export family protein [Pyrinomonadaceae bacterium]